MNKFKITITCVGLTILLILGAMCNPIVIVNAGQRGVKVTMGKVSPQSYTEGVHFVTPFISHIYQMNVKTQKS